MRFTRFAAASAALTMAVGAFTVSTSFADPPPVSALVASPTTVTVDVNPAALNHTAPVTLALDANCRPATDNTGYTVVPGASGYVTVSPTDVAVADCDHSASFTITGTVATPAAPPDTLLHFSAVAKNHGLQKKVRGTDIVIVVIDTRDPGNPPCTQDCPTTGGNPAAPAVANALLKTVPGLADQCKKHFNDAKNWRGLTISAIADQMPKPESIKNTYTELGWITFVKYELGSFPGLYGLCGFTLDQA